MVSPGPTCAREPRLGVVARIEEQVRVDVDRGEERDGEGGGDPGQPSRPAGRSATRGRKTSASTAMPP